MVYDLVSLKMEFGNGCIVPCPQQFAFACGEIRSASDVEDMIHYTTKFRFQAHQIVNQIISNSPKKQEQKRDMKRIKQDGISILEVCLPPP